ncbi:MAG: adenylate/guanylate cyclase domain-containing protein [Gammaproteobacteria bacterium]|nr:adenylate/guanylate cyclase domain-containing protein [Gammaproteobacteria bacterium]MDH4255821.1 adenylate/guanylate cyclase domain-containing protein [Gammaproteobacteria bacterium]MDH5310351.1 adenylate/guanylate cyclase domain-containing protein [Gammaproteobacteria bacterium]
MNFPYDMLDDPGLLAEYQGWDETVYADFLALQRGELTEAQFDRRYRRTRAILVLDMTGFTATAMNTGELASLLRIFDAQKVCLPVLTRAGASFVRCFADNLVALFDRPDPAADAALEIQRRIALFNATPLASADPARCCIGIGFGPVYAIGPNLAQGDEMNRASKLGEDIARGGEVLLTEKAAAALRARSDLRIEPQSVDDAQFSFFRLLASA